MAKTKRKTKTAARRRDPVGFAEIRKLHIGITVDANGAIESTTESGRKWWGASDGNARYVEHLLKVREKAKAMVKAVDSILARIAEPR